MDIVDQALNAIEHLEQVRDKNDQNYGVVTSMDNRIGPIRTYVNHIARKRADGVEPIETIAVLRSLLDSDEYLSTWRKQNV